MKKRTLKVLSTAVAAVLCLGMAAGCGTKDDKGNQANNASKAPETNTKSELVMGTNAAFPPFEFVTSQGLVGEFDGIDVAIADKIAKESDKTLKIEDMEFESLITALNTGKVDMVLAGMTANEERRQSVDFSDPYFVASQVIVVAKDDTAISSSADLQGKKIGVVQGYTGDDIVTGDLKIEPAVRTSRGIDAVQELKNGKLDAVVIDSATGEALAKKNDLKIVKDPEAFESEEYAIAVQKGNTELLEKINKVLSDMKESGEIDKLADKYGQQA